MAAAALPGLYKSGQLHAIDPEALRNYDSDSEPGDSYALHSIGCTIADPQQPPAAMQPSSKAGSGKRTQLGQQQHGSKPKQAMHRLDGHRDSDQTVPAKRSSKGALPGRLRKKLAKERSAAAAAKQKT